MDPNHATLLMEIRRFKSLFQALVVDLGPNFSYIDNFPLMTDYIRQQGGLPPMACSDSNSDLEEPEGDGGYMSHSKFEDDDEEKDEFEEDDDPPLGFNMEDWLADYEAIEAETAQEEN